MLGAPFFKVLNSNNFFVTGLHDDEALEFLTPGDPSQCIR